MPRLARAALIATVAIAATLWPAAAAHADGDPASDVLVSQDVFLASDAGASAGQIARLEAAVRAGGRNGYGVRVAVIASPADLGSIPELWRHPQSYAQFLGEELSLAYRGRVLVVMPAGLGLYPPAAVTRAEQAVLARPPPRTPLVPAALSAVEELATAAGHPIAVAGVGPPPEREHSPDWVAWVVFAAGNLIIVLSWCASLRAVPWASRRARPWMGRPGG